jgi:AraC family transcriptional regulator of adaptative response / DNA-3-methyladenine glycosylase II
MVFATDAAPKPHVTIEISPSLVPVLMPLLARLRQLFDLDAEPTAIDAHLAEGGLGALVARRPGVRIPGALDGFEAVLRVLLRGSPRAGARVGEPARRVVDAFGEELDTGCGSLVRLTPSAARIAEAGAPRLAALGTPLRRAELIVSVARAIADGTLRLELGSDLISTNRALTDLVGARIASAIVMRALYWPDAFPFADRSLRRTLGFSTAEELRACAEQWRPWRAYAAAHLWLHANSARPGGGTTTAELHRLGRAIGGYGLDGV